MNLKQILEEHASNASSRYSPEMIERMEAGAKLLQRQDIISNSLKVGNSIPNTVLKSHSGHDVSIDEVANGQPYILTFYRGGWCPYCNLELRAYQTILQDINTLGAKLIAITSESPDDSMTTAEKNKLDFTILTDTNHAFSQSMGICFDMPADLQLVYKELGIDLSLINASGKWILPIPATFIVNRNGQIAKTFIDLNYRVRLEPKDALNALMLCF